MSKDKKVETVSQGDNKDTKKKEKLQLEIRTLEKLETTGFRYGNA